jgi:DNA-binding LacI/PurR family transcriptional regulator
MNPNKEVVVRPLAKFDSACARLSQMAYALGPEARMPTFVELCEATSLSKATLGSVLGQLEAQGILLRRHGAGIFVSPRLKRSIALVCDPQFSLDPRIRGFWELIVREARLRVESSRHQLAFHFSTMSPDATRDDATRDDATRNGPPLHAGLMDDIRANRVQGVLTVGVPLEAVEWMSAQGVALVAFGGWGPASVNMNGADIVRLGVEALAARGCRRIALWSSTGCEPERDSRRGNRLEVQAFRREMAARDLKFDARQLRPRAREKSVRSSFEQARDWVRETFEGRHSGWPDGLLLDNDILARDVMAALQKLDIRPNRDIVIASHANSDSPVLRAYEDDLTLLEYDSGEIVQTMFDKLEAVLRGEVLLHPHVQIKPKIRTAKSS